MCCASLLEAAIEGTKGDAMRRLRIFEHISLDGVIEVPAVLAITGRECRLRDFLALSSAKVPSSTSV